MFLRPAAPSGDSLCDRALLALPTPLASLSTSLAVFWPGLHPELKDFIPVFLLLFRERKYVGTVEAFPLFVEVGVVRVEVAPTLLRRIALYRSPAPKAGIAGPIQDQPHLVGMEVVVLASGGHRRYRGRHFSATVRVDLL